MVNYRDVPGQTGYRVGDDGSFWSIRHPKHRGQWVEIKAHRRARYMRVVMYSKGGRSRSVSLHRLVLEVFVGPCPVGHEACHRDENRMNNSLINLFWASHRRNVQDYFGSRRKGDQSVVVKRINTSGSRHYLAKLTESNVATIRADYAKGTVQAELAKKYGVTIASISHIVRRRTWKHVP